MAKRKRGFFNNIYGQLRSAVEQANGYPQDEQIENIVAELTEGETFQALEFVRQEKTRVRNSGLPFPVYRQTKSKFRNCFRLRRELEALKRIRRIV